MCIIGHHGNSFLSFGAVGEVGGWIELGRTTLGSAGDTIEVGSLADKRYYMLLSDLIASGTIQSSYRAGNGSLDSGSNYARRQSTNGGTDSTAVSQTRMSPFNNISLSSFNVAYMANLSAAEKLMIGHSNFNNSAGAGAAPNREEFVNKWVNTANPLDTLANFNAAAGSYATDSELVILGWDPADTHTSNFWEVLVDVDLSTGEADTISSGVFTSKKYLWIQCFLESSGTVQDGFRVGKTTVDTGTNYASRQSVNGTTDTTTTNSDDIGDFSNIGANQFMNMFIVNTASNEKLIQYWIVAPGSTGAGTAPTRLEVVGKWANTVDQIDVLEWRNVAGAGNYGKKSFLKVWGSN